MKKTKASLLLHPVFLIALGMLVTNDIFWKYAYPNWLTGKLSDFAGMIVLPVFFRELFPRFSGITISVWTTGLFIGWKSVLSQPFIDFANSYLQLPVSRVADYTDLVAIVLLPLAFYIQPKALPLQLVVQKITRWSIASLTFLSLCSTSMPYRHLFQAHPTMEDLYFHESITLKQSASSVLQTLSRKGIGYRLDSVMYYPVLNQRDLFYRAKQEGDSGSKWQPISQSADSVLYVRWEGGPYYLITFYKSGDRVLRNIRFSLSENSKKTKTVLKIETFIDERMSRYAMLGQKERKEYKRIFRSLFE